MKLSAPGFDETAQEQDSGPHMPTQWTLVTRPAMNAAALVSMLAISMSGLASFGQLDALHFWRAILNGKGDERHPDGDKGQEGQDGQEPRLIEENLSDREVHRI